MSSSRRARAALALVLFTAGPACATRSAGPAEKSPPARLTPARRLASDLDAIFSTAPADGAVWGVVVREAGGGPLLYDRNPRRLLHPASTMKLVTLAAAVDRLGWDFRFETTLRATTPLEAGGVIRGDLVITGSGDPTISRRHGGLATLAEWADRLWQLGVRRIEGRIIGDGSAFGGTTLGSGWQWDDLAASYAAPVSALSYNENTVELLVTPGTVEGARASVTFADAAGNVPFANAIRTVAGGSARRLSIERGPNGTAVVVSGEVPVGYSPFKIYLTVADPPLYFARAVRDALIARGIVVVGEARSAETDPPGPFAPDADVILRHRSPPLGELAATLMKVSQNLYAELLLHAIGSRMQTPPAEALATVLAGWGVGTDGFVAADGSGLSRYDLVTAATLDAVLTRMFGGAVAREPWLASLPIAGIDGTLQRRMKGTPAEGRVFAKTGSIAYVRSLAGYARAADGRWIQFAILANNFAGTVTPGDIDRIVETAVLRLVAH